MKVVLTLAVSLFLAACASKEKLASISDRGICSKAVAYTDTSVVWRRGLLSVGYVSEARRRGLTPYDCDKSRGCPS